MTIRVQHKRSAVKGKVPQPADLEYGEIAVNYEATDPSLYVKDSANAVRKIGTPPNASTTVHGVVQLADAAAVTAGTAGLVVDAAQLKAHAATDATMAAKGVVQLADAAAITAGTVGRVVDAAQLKAAKYALPTASATVLGGVKVGTNLAIDATGILSAKVTGALVFKGAKDPTVALPPTPTPATGDVYVMSTAGVLAAGWTGLVGTSVALHELVVWDGTEWVLMGSAVETTVHTVTGTAPLHATGTTAVTLRVDAATAAAKGVVQLADAAAITAGTAGRVVDAADLKAAKYTLPTATAAALGGVKVGTNLSIDANGILSAKVTGALIFKGAKDPTVALPAAPAPATGDVYVMNKAGVLAAGWTGLVGSRVSIHELVVFDGTEWVLMGSAVETTVHTITATAPLHAAGTTAVTMRVDDASATAKGVVQLATAAEVTAGTDTAKAVTSAGVKVELDKKAPLASPSLTGTPTAPTAAAGTNTTQLATTAFVHAAVAAEDLWDRTGTEITPKTAGDSVFTSGAVKVGGTTASPSITLKADGQIVSRSHNNGDSLLVQCNSAPTGGTGPGISFEMINNGSVMKPLAFIKALMTGGAVGAERADLQFATAAPGTAPAEKARLTADGNFLLGGTLPASPAVKLGAAGVIEVSDSYRFTNAPVDGSEAYIGYNPHGHALQVINHATASSAVGVELVRGATAWAPSTSESRLKDIRSDADANQCWDLIRDIELKRYYYKDQADKTGVAYLGPMADWLGVQDPELLIDTGRTDEHGPIHTYNQGLLDMKALAALSAALKRIEDLETRLAALEPAAPHKQADPGVK